MEKLGGEINQHREIGWVETIYTYVHTYDNPPQLSEEKERKITKEEKMRVKQYLASLLDEEYQKKQWEKTNKKYSKILKKMGKNQNDAINSNKDDDDEDYT